MSIFGTNNNRALEQFYKWKEQNYDKTYTVKFWYMHDTHTFTRIKGSNLDEILENADKIEKDNSYGMLCPAILMCGDKEVRRVGSPAHSRGSKDSKEHWNAGKKEWRQAIESDKLIMSLFNTWWQ